MPSPTPADVPPEDPPRFALEPLIEIARHLERAVGVGGVDGEIDGEANGQREAVLEVPDPDRGAALGVGRRSRDAHGAFVARPLRVWCDLADRAGCRLGTPRPVGGGFVRLRFTPLPPAPRSADPLERYGPGSAFSDLDKSEDADPLLSLVEAYGRVGLAPGARVLVLGAGSGWEVAALPWARGAPDLGALEVVALDHAPAVTAALVERFAGRPSVRAVRADAAALGAALGDARFDLVVAVALLQSPGVDRDALLREIVRARLAPGGAAILGFPNARLRRGDQLWGARTPNVGPVELGTLLRDVAATRRYLQQQRFRVFASGKYDLLLTAVPAGRRGRAVRAAGDGSGPGERAERGW